MIARAVACDERRRAFFAEHFPDFWATVECHPHALLEAHRISAEAVSTLRAAAHDAWTIFERVLPVLQNLPYEQLATIGIPEPARNIVRETDTAAGPAVLARFDIALTERGPKILELNAETPFLLWESHEIAGFVAEHLGYANPNADARGTLLAAQSRCLANVPPGARIAVTALNTWREDWFTAAFIARTLREATGREVEIIPTSELRVADGFLRDARGEAIDVLWRMYPLEHFSNDRGGRAFCDLIERGRLRIINPPAALLLQNKAALAVIWGLHEARSYFTPDEHERIERLFLRSSMEPLSGVERYVRKPVLGREGNSVAIVEAGRVVETSNHASYAAQPALYQEFVELPKIAYHHPVEGPREDFGIYTAFVAGGEVSALCLRVGARITDAWAHVLPLAL